MDRVMVRRILTDVRPAVWLSVLGSVVVVAIVARAWPAEEQVDFNRDVRPILNARCIACHGGVRQAGGFGLVFREDAVGRTESGAYGIVPGDPGASEMVRRILHADPAERMPRDGPALTTHEVDVLRRWIDQGAVWADHWAYVKPEAVPLPEVRDEAWVQNGIDQFVLARLEAEGLEPSPRAECASLIRRVSLDLIGLPPTPEEADAFCEDPSARAYEEVVDRLLESPRYGEHRAAMWLDLARYADTKGYEKDVHRTIWKYRDWVIRAFNRNLPFDRFTIEQLAGDLLPGATNEQVLATAFHRNTMTNDEGGTDDEEFRVAAVIDRVNTTWEVWQGTTMACVQCHSHPYDPFRHEDYYRLFAYFNSTADGDWYDESPRLVSYGESEERRAREILDWLARAGAGPDALVTASLHERIEKALYPHGRWAASSYAASMGVGGEDEFISPKRDGAHVHYAGVDLTGVGEIAFGYVAGEHGGAIEVRLGGPSGRQIAFAELDRAGADRVQGTARVPISRTEGRHDVYFVLRRPEDGGFRLHWFALSPALEGTDGAGARAILQRRRALAAIAPEVETPVMWELPPGRRRVTHVFERGNWLVPGDTVEPDVPGSLPPSPDGTPANRLGLAEWLVSPENPLTARVTVNRFWAQLFGTGIVETLEDFGVQGEPPSHPKLLDWLALRFMNENGWRMKALLEEIVLSATYQQASRVSRELRERDPYNRLLARGPRVRLSAEQVRDQALAVSGLLSDKMYGPSVMPPQPPELWNSPYNEMDWTTASGEDRYRRAVYTYWKRTVPYPSMTAFDAPSRETAVSRRIRTNTPLQALVTLNDPVYVEAAQALARRMVRSGPRLEDRLRTGYQRALLGEPDAATVASLRSLYEEAARYYGAHPERLEGAITPYMPYMPHDTADAHPRQGSEPIMLQTAAASDGVPSDSVEVAALTTVAGVILNLDAFLTKN